MYQRCHVPSQLSSDGTRVQEPGVSRLQQYTCGTGVQYRMQYSMQSVLLPVPLLIPVAHTTTNSTE
jgi:hypothetical protein